jgi:hypothetical protein
MVMETTETLMADQFDAIIRRLTRRIETDAERPKRKGNTIKALKKRLKQMRDIRSHFNDTN